MERFRWYELELPSSVKSFVTALKRARYGGEESFGFLPIEERRGEERFRFLWTAYLSQVRLSPEGQTTVQRVPTLNYCEFAIFQSKKRTWLRVEDPPRNVRELLNALETTAGFGFSAQLVLQLQKNREPIFPAGAEKRLVSLKVLTALPKENALARIEAASKEGLELDNFSLVRGGEYRIEQLTYEVIYKRTKGQVTLTNTGTMKISGQLSPFLLDSLESAFTTG